MGRKPKTANHKIKALSKYLEDTSHSEFARSVQISHTHLSLILSGARKASLKVANRIIQETRLKVTIKDLRPDIYDAVMKHGEKNNGKG